MLRAKRDVLLRKGRRMAVASKADIRRWLKYADSVNNSHMVVISGDFPIYCPRGKDVHKFIEGFKKEQGSAYNAYQVMEIYNLDMDYESQLAAYRRITYKKN